MKSKLSILNLIIIIIGAVVLVYGLTQRSESTVLVGEVDEAIVEASADQVDDANEGKLIIVSGRLGSTGELKDEYFGISKDTIKLKRLVEMYQWAQDCTNGCTYYQTWSEALIDSKSFDDVHKNPDTKQYNSEEYFEEKVHLGAYTLSEKLVNDLHYDTVMGPDEITDVYSGSYNLVGEYITNVDNMDAPKIGDFRISYEYVKDKDATVVAKQTEGSFGPFYTESKKEIYEIVEGAKTASEYISNMERNHSILGIALTVIGALFILIGITATIFDILRSRKKTK